MSTKRQATTELNHENWDQEDPEEKKEADGFKMARKEVLEKRVMRTAKRRSQVTGEQKSVFSGFSGFNKTQQTSMDFLANLTNGSKSNNSVSILVTDTESGLPGPINSKPTDGQGGALFSISGATTSNTITTFGQSTPKSSIFGNIGTTPTFTQSDRVVTSSSVTTKPTDSQGGGLFSISRATTSNTKLTFGQPTPESTIFGKIGTTPALTQSEGVVTSSSEISKPTYGRGGGLFSDARAITSNIKSTFGQSTPESTIFGKIGTTNDLTQSDRVVTSSSVITQPVESHSGGLFSVSGTSTSFTKSAFGQSPESGIFGKIGNTPAYTQSVFSSTKTEPTVKDSPFKIQDVSSKPNVNFTLQSNVNNEKPAAQVSSTLFGISSANTSNNSTPFSTKASSPTLTKTSITSNSPQKDSELNKSTSKSDIKDDKKLIYYRKLKGLNESVTAWIKKHVEETPLCILSPIFRDYEKHLKDIEDEYDKSKEGSPYQNISDTKKITESKSATAFSGNNLSSTLYPNSTISTTSLFSSTSSTLSSTVEKTSNFSFGINTPTTGSANNFSTAAIPSTGFSFGIKPSSANISPLSATSVSVSPTNTNTAATNNSPFSFGIGKPFAFNSNIKSNEEPAKEGDDNEDEPPPQVEYTPIAEENSVYDIKCKVFVKKDANYIDKGVGTLYIKKIEESGKYQLLVRANTSLGNVLINMILSSSVPIQKMGKNNVMMICIPTPDAKPPPVSILIRVKTSENADALLETLNKFKT